MIYNKCIISATGLLVLLMSLVSLSCANKAKPQQNSTLKEYLSRTESLGFSGIVHIQKNDTVLLSDAKGFSNREKGIKNKIETPFYIASISKSFTAAAIVKLEDNEKLSTRDSISKFFESCPKDKANITIHQLLTHTSGIGSFGWDNTTNYWKTLSKKEAVEGILNNPLISTPNESFNYNNANYILLSAIIEAVSGKSYQNYIETALLKPLSIQSTYFRYSLDKELPALANSYIGDEDYKKYTDYPKSWLNIGGGDIISTASDMNKWITGLFEKDILSKEGKSKIFSIQKTINPNFGYGYGWYIKGFPDSDKKVIFHTGGFKGYSSELRYYPHSKITTVVFTNDDVIPNATEVISNHLLGNIYDTNIVIPKVSRHMEHKENFVGIYKIDSSSKIEIKPKKEGLAAEYYGQSAINFIYEYDGIHKKEIKGLNEKTALFLFNLLIDPNEAFSKVLPEEDMKYIGEYVEEWNGFNDADSSSINLNHTIYLGNNIYRTFITLTNQNTNKYFAFTWKEKTLIGTVVNAKFKTPMSTLFYSNHDKLTTYDWGKSVTLDWVFSKKSDSEYHTLTIKNKEAKVIKAEKSH